MSRAVVLKAPAKVNLTLEVLGARADGYHELASVFATVDLSDRVRVAPWRELDVRIAHPSSRPRGRSRVARRGAPRTRRGRRHSRTGAFANDPRCYGLGGRSSDDGAGLRGSLACGGLTVWIIWGRQRAWAGLPFFVSGAGTVVPARRSVEELPSPPALDCAGALREHVSTAEVFAAYRAKSSTGERSAKLAKGFRDRQVTPALIRECLHNDLLEAAESVTPAIAHARTTASALGIDLAMSGSGPSLFALGDDRSHAIQIARRLRRAGLRVRVVRLGVTP